MTMHLYYCEYTRLGCNNLERREIGVALGHNSDPAITEKTGKIRDERAKLKLDYGQCEGDFLTSLVKKAGFRALFIDYKVPT